MSDTKWHIVYKKPDRGQTHRVICGRDITHGQRRFLEFRMSVEMLFPPGVCVNCLKSFDPPTDLSVWLLRGPGGFK